MGSVSGHERLRALGGPWYVGDALGSVRQTLDDAGGVLGNVQYDPWGVPTAGTPQPFGFTGELHSAGQVSLRARWYAPGQGTFTTRDPFAGFAEMPYSLHAYQYAYSDPLRWTDPSGRCVPEWVPGGEPGCTLRAGIGQGRLDWQGAGDYAWDVVQGVGLPGAMAVDALAGTNGTQQILDDAGTGTYLGVAFTGVTTLGGLQSGGAIRNAALRGQVWLTSGSRLAVGVGLVGLGLNAADDGALWLRILQGDCAAFGEWAALQQLGAADGLLPFGDVLAAGLLLPGRTQPWWPRISNLSPDWATKGAHIHVNNVELRVLPGYGGSIVFKPVFSSTPDTEVQNAIRVARRALHDPGFRHRLHSNASRAVEYLGQSGNPRWAAKSAELKFLMKALEKGG